VGVLATVNAYGDIYHPHTGAMVAGVPAGLESRPGLAGANTTLVVVATDAGLTRVQARKVAEMAHDGMARAIRPAHTMYDGDTVFALATGGTIADVTEVGALAADLVGEAIVRAVEMGGKAP
jgi:L-aminopeptidase/D-esterase-like protein